MWFHYRGMGPKDAEGRANSVDPDQIAFEGESAPEAAV